MVDRIEAVVAETRQTGFHFVDEAAPPKALKALAAELQARGLSTPGGAPSASRRRSPRALRSSPKRLHRDLRWPGSRLGRLLKLMKKRRVGRPGGARHRAFADAGRPGPRLLMYGFPTQTVQDTVDRAGENVPPVIRKRLHPQRLLPPLHLAPCIFAGGPESAGLRGVAAPLPEGPFAKNDVGFSDATGVDHDRSATRSEKRCTTHARVGLEEDVRVWFEEESKARACPGPPSRRPSPRRSERKLGITG